MAIYNKKTIEDIDVDGKRVLVRVDFNVPLDENRNVTNDARIVGALPTINYLIKHKAKIILVSHLGRPKNGFEEKFSMKPAAEKLSELLKQPVIMAKDVIGDDAKAKSMALGAGEVLMLENVRFHKEEEANDPAFAKELASLAEIYVNDAFGTAHRAHASTAGVADYLPAVCGFLIQKEIEFMGNILGNPERPFVAILGGAKVSDKIKVIENLIEQCDAIIIGGGMAYTFLKAKGYKIGSSLCEDDKIELAGELIKKADARGVELLLPIGSIVAKEFKNDSESKYVPSDDMPDGWMGVDIGSLTVEQFSKVIGKAKTIVWNGPMGVFEFPNFAVGTRDIATAVAESNAISVVGGGDSAAAIEQMGFGNRITHISTGGGASLEFLEGKTLPGIAVLLEKNPRRKIIAGNWKMNKTPSETTEFIRELAGRVKDAEAEVIVAVPAICLRNAVDAAAGTNIVVAAQNVHFEEKGAFTGEISVSMLKDLGIEYVIIGHSERRQYFGETDLSVNKKIHTALDADIKPIVCVGETLQQRDEGVTHELVRLQVKIALDGVEKEQVEGIVIAYEPIWAIGTGRTATNEQANDVCAIIREVVTELYDRDVSEKIRIQYGGSVTAANSKELFDMIDIDGGLVGGASLKLDEFEMIANYTA